MLWPSWGLAVSAAVLVGACGGGAPASPTHRVAVETTAQPSVRYLSPLRGLPVEDAEARNRPALAVKIDNRPEARPQIGLEAADVVYEELTEGGITRFLAVFHSILPPEVGPIRSVRPVDPALLAPLDGVFAYSGGTPPNVEALKTQRSTPIDETAAGAAMRRAGDRPVPHNLIGIPERLIEQAPRADPPAPLFEFGALPREAGEPCATASIAFSEQYVSTYDWVPGIGWIRSTHGQRLTTASGAEIAPTNVVIVIVVDQSAEATVGRGGAFLLRDGVLVRGSWQRASMDEPMRLVDAAGARLRLAPGITWVHLAIAFQTRLGLCGSAGAS